MNFFLHKHCADAVRKVLHFASKPFSSTQQTVVANALSAFSLLLVATNPVASLSVFLFLVYVITPLLLNTS